MNVIKVLGSLVNLVNPIQSISNDRRLPPERKLSIPRTIIVTVFLVGSLYVSFFSDAPMDVKEQQLEQLEDITEDAVDLLGAQEFNLVLPVAKMEKRLAPESKPNRESYPQNVPRVLTVNIRSPTNNTKGTVKLRFRESVDYACT